jgi:hypothetical protein
VFGPKCHWMQLEYEIKFMMAGMVLGALIAAAWGSRLELRRRRAVQQATQTGEPS